MRDFFSNFAQVEYPIDGFSKQVANIAIGEITIKYKVDESLILWQKELLDEDNPISISNEVYGSTEFYWTILYINDVVNPYLDWFKGQGELEDYTNTKYPSGKTGLHHFERVTPVYGKSDKVRILDDVDHAASLAIYNTNPAGLPQYVFPVTNLQYERVKNQEKKTITVINPKYVADFSDNFHRIMAARVSAPTQRPAGGPPR